MKTTTASIIVLSILFVLISGFFVVSCDSKQTNTDAQIITNKIDTFLTELEDKRFSGSVLVEYKGEKILSKGYGKSDREANIQN